MTQTNTMDATEAQQRLAEARAWWSTKITDVRPNYIGIRGYPIEQLIGHLRYSEMVWLLLRGELPNEKQAQLLDVALVSGVDHGLHAPSGAISRMAITCGLPVNGAMASAINVLDDSHGGAGQQCMSLLYDIDRRLEGRNVDESVVVTAIDRYVEQHGKIIGGFGHRFHDVDPRAVRILALVRQARDEGTIAGRFADIAIAVEQTLTSRKRVPIPLNVDGATAVIFCELGFAPELGRGIYILSRAAGILAHAWEQIQEGRTNKGPMPPTIDYTYAGPAKRDFVKPVS